MGVPVPRGLEGQLGDILERIQILEMRNRVPATISGTVQWSQVADKPVTFPPNQATESTIGGARIATSVQMDAGTNDQVAVTPLKLAPKLAGKSDVGHTHVAAAITDFQAAVLALVHPVGSIYMSVSSANPGTVMGGTWVAWGSGRVPVGVDVGQTEFDTVEETGGEKTHTLTAGEIPAHTHSIFRSGSFAAGGYGGFAQSNTASTEAQNTSSTGGGGAHNNLPPYITCYMWKRTA